MTIRLQFVTLSWLSLSRLSTAFVPSGSLNKQQLVKHASCESLEDFDKLRNSFEHLLDQHADSISDHPLFLTSASRRRRQLELDLLRSLEDSDDAVDELMHMWMYEGTPEEAEMLVAMEGECSSGLFKEEAMLKNMIQSHPTWCEPCLRLATLLYFKGRTEDSYAFAHRAMELKPWHFEIYPLLIMLSLRGSSPSFKQAVQWARKGLPPVQGRRRKGWVERALQEAQFQFEQAEMISQEARREPDMKIGGSMWQ